MRDRGDPERSGRVSSIASLDEHGSRDAGRYCAGRHDRCSVGLTSNDGPKRSRADRDLNCLPLTLCVILRNVWRNLANSPFKQRGWFNLQVPDVKDK
jgi:hypothetical protein